MAARYAASQEPFRRYEQGMKQRLAHVCLEYLNRQKVVTLHRKLYRVLRLTYGPDLAPALAEAGARAVREGLKPRLVLEIVSAGCAEMGRELAPGQARELRQVVSVTAANKEGYVEKSEAVKARTEPVRGRARTVSASALGRETPLEEFRRQRGLKALGEALAMHQPVVKRCVVRRLLDRLSYEELAAELGLTRDQVKEILTGLKPWVFRFTTYFDDDWHWFEGCAPGLGPAAA